MDEPDSRLAAISRPPRVSPGALDMLAVAAQREGVTARRRRITIVGVSALLAIGGGVVAAPAAADVVRSFLAQSGWFPQAGGEILDESEWIDTSQPDLRDYLETVYPTWLKLAPTQTRTAILDDVAENAAANPALTQEVSLRRGIEARAYCGWAVELLDAQRVGDQRRYDEAAAIVLSASEWPALVATDGGGITDRLREVGIDAVNDDKGAAHAVFRAGECGVLGFSSGAGA